MPSVSYQSKRVDTLENESVLDALLRSGQEIPFSCKSGTCHSCMMRVSEGSAPDKSQLGLKESLIEQGFFLSCVAKPKDDIRVELPNSSDLEITATVAEVNALSPDVAEVILELAEPFDFRAGQFINLVRDDGLVRSYSVASLPSALPRLELHVRRIPDGRMSRWLADGNTAGSSLKIRGPAGDCFYLPKHADQDLLLSGTGTGLAPLLGIVRDALAQGHRGKIVLYHGARQESGLYLVDELKELDRDNACFSYHSCVLSGDDEAHRVGPLDEIVLARHSDLTGWRVYLCGAPDFVLPMRKKTFLAGAHSKEIHADAFLTAGSAGKQ